jgi:hypothetical protein
MGGDPLRFTLVGRSWCHLCDDMLDALRAGMSRLDRRYTVDVIDIDTGADPALLARYDELVPVLLDAAGNELCHYFLDEGAVARYAAAPPASARTRAFCPEIR